MSKTATVKKPFLVFISTFHQFNAVPFERWLPARRSCAGRLFAPADTWAADTGIIAKATELPVLGSELLPLPVSMPP
jgi:hypothetical protein